MQKSQSHKDSKKKKEKTQQNEKSSKKQEKIKQKTEEKQKQEEQQIYEFLNFPPSNQQEFRAVLLHYLTSDLFQFPINSKDLFASLLQAFSKIKNSQSIMTKLDITPILNELQERNAIKMSKYSMGTTICDYITDINQEKLKLLRREFYKDMPRQISKQESELNQINVPKINSSMIQITQPFNMLPPFQNSQVKQQEIERILKQKVGFQREAEKEAEALCMIMNRSTAKAQEYFKKHGSKQIDYCEYGLKEKCQQMRGASFQCKKAHFRKIIKPHTNEALGNCSYLDTCRHMDYCKFIHYELDIQPKSHSPSKDMTQSDGKKEQQVLQEQTSEENFFPPQWVNCDLRKIDFKTLGKFDVIMADPPWDIHMCLPYETMKDKEMKAMRIDLLQDQGLIFLWVTGRAMELGRECLQLWGYKRIEEIIWLKTNQLQRIIRTGRTGHWLNHSKEHCLVGIKGDPKINRNIDCDVIVSEVRETSRKPDEIYGLIERMCPGSKKIELFGRPHNCQNGWLTLGNQLPGVYLVDPEIRQMYHEAYPEVDVSIETMMKNRQLLGNETQIQWIYNSHIQLNQKIKQSSQQQDAQTSKSQDNNKINQLISHQQSTENKQQQISQFSENFKQKQQTLEQKQQFFNEYSINQNQE